MKRFPNQPHLRNLALLALLAAVAMSGCGFYKKMQANKKNEEIGQKVSEIEAQQAQRFLPQDFQRLQQTYGNARSSVDTGNYDQALQAGDEALGIVDQIQARLPQAKQAIEAKKTQLVDLHSRITNTMEEIKMLGPDETLLIERAVEIDNLINQVQNSQVQVSEGDLGYDAGLMAAGAFLNEATMALANLEMQRAQDLVTRIEEAWNDAQNLEVVKYVPESESVLTALQSAKDLIAAGSYRAALQQYSQIPEDVVRYRERARERRAEDRIAQAERIIQLAESDPDASLDAIENAKSSVQEAATALQEGNYDSAYSSASNAIEIAREQVKGIEDDLRAQIEELASRVETSLDYNTPQIAPELYQTAVGHLDEARSQVSDILFDRAQNSIDQGAEVIEQAIAEARTKGLTDRADEDEEKLQATQEIGAFQYLREEYQAIQELLAEARSQVAKVEFDEAEQTLGQAEERILGLELSLRDLAQNRLASAEAAHQEALEAQAGEFAEDTLEESQNLLEEARSASASSIWRDAIGTAEEAQNKAQQAAQQAYRIRTENLRPNAEEAIEEAEQAGSQTYAADLYNRARAAQDNSAVAFQEEHYRTALEELAQAQDLAVDARRHLIDVAQAAVDSAIEAQADQYQEALIGEAIANLGEARAKMDDKDYAASRQLATDARSKAETAEFETWKERSTKAIADLAAGVERASENRAPTYAEAEFGTATRTLEEAQAAAAKQQFQEAYVAADRGARELEAVFARLEDEARLVRGEYDRLVGTLKSYVEDDFGRALHVQAVARLGQIDDAILRNEYRRIFDLYEEGTAEVNNQIVATKVHNINVKRDALVAAIGEATSMGLFALVEQSAEGLQTELAAITYDPALDRLKPEVDYYTETVRELARIEGEIERLRDAALTNIEDRVQQVRTDIDNAGKIGARELVPSTFNAAVDSFEMARDMAYLVRNDLEGSEGVTFTAMSQQLASAEALADELNQAAIVKNNSVNYLRDLVFWTFDMTRFLDQWYPVEELGYEMILTSAPGTEADTYAVMQVGIDASDLLKEAERLYRRVQPITPPPPQADLHALALRSFRLFVKAADGFYRFGQYNRYPKRMRQRFLAEAFQDLERLHQLNDELLVDLMVQVQAYDLEDFEREFADEFNAFKSYVRRDKTTR
jgi:hypothetical protein